ncbi:MAG TPA: hypothetical protein VGL93_17220 [Streptosporangiaceae bacterium]|jgi:hypothetical protein
MLAYDRSASELDIEHITAVCDDAAHQASPGAAHIRLHAVQNAVYTAMGTDEQHLAATHTLRRVGYHVDPSPDPGHQPPLQRWIRVDGWSHDALTRRLDALTATAHQLAETLPINVAHAINTYTTISDLSDLDDPQYQAAAQLRTQLKEHVTATTGPHAPYNPDRLPHDPDLTALLKRVRAAEHRVDDLISRTWINAADAIGRYSLLSATHSPTLASAYALIDSLNPAFETTRRDTIITVLEWARAAGHGDAITYAHWYADTYETCENGPHPATAYTTWRNRGQPTDPAHPPTIADHDHPRDAERPIDNPETITENRTNERNSSSRGRRAS